MEQRQPFPSFSRKIVLCEGGLVQIAGLRGMIKSCHCETLNPLAEVSTRRQVRHPGEEGQRSFSERLACALLSCSLRSSTNSVRLRLTQDPKSLYFADCKFPLLLGLT